ncbi:Pentatricopeptide repeat-containing protein At3g06920 [Durusdinium trenchii]|uniref:Pentatricopeptide repeat-containing protein At3g06920 n=1 Tax=Durusdinium trenchii TaxID=1381693 RepID=A0ABP0ITX8_9DINO
MGARGALAQGARGALAMRKDFWQQALQLIADLSQRRTHPSVFTLNKTLAVLKDADKGLLAHDFFGTFPERRVDPDLVSYNITTSALERSSLWQKAIANVRELIEANLSPNVISLNSLLSAIGRASNWRGALLVFSTDVTLTRTRKNDMRTLSDLFTMLKTARAHPDGASYGIAIKACVEVMEWRQALALLPESSSFPSKISERAAITTVLSGCSIASKWLQGLMILHKRFSDFRFRDSALVGAMVNACASGQAWQLAIATWNEHFELSNEVVLRSVIAACELGSWEVAMLLLGTYRHNYGHLHFTSIASVAAMASAAKATQWQLVLLVLQEGFVSCLWLLDQAEGHELKQGHELSCFPVSKGREDSSDTPVHVRSWDNGVSAAAPRVAKAFEV